MATKNDKVNKPIDSEIFLVIFLMLIIVVLPLAISVWDIGSPVPGFSVPII
jgi:hypothetical protein